MKETKNTKKSVVIILSITSDIGFNLAKNYLADGFFVVGTYRTYSSKIRQLKQFPCVFLKCDVANNRSITSFIHKLKTLNLTWDVCISCIGEPRPLTAFFKTNFDDWLASVNVNSFQQLRIVHALYETRSREKTSAVVFFAGGGVNKSVVNFSAYTIGKIILIKMCEYLDAENSDLNIFIVGPGWTKTKTHQLILNDTSISKEKRLETIAFLQSKSGTDTDYIYECIARLVSAKKIVSGRNFSIVYDPLQKNKFVDLMGQLKQNPDLFKLRRYERKSNEIPQNHR